MDPTLEVEHHAERPQFVGGVRHAQPAIACQSDSIALFTAFGAKAKPPTRTTSSARTTPPFTSRLASTGIATRPATPRSSVVAQLLTSLPRCLPMSLVAALATCAPTAESRIRLLVAASRAL